MAEVDKIDDKGEQQQGKTRTPSRFVGMKDFENSINLSDQYNEESIDPLQDILCDRTFHQKTDEDQAIGYSMVAERQPLDKLEKLSLRIENNHSVGISVNQFRDSLIMNDALKVHEVNNKIDQKKFQENEPRIKERNYEKEYLHYLYGEHGKNQMIVSDSNQELMKPRLLEKKLREKFITNLKDRRKMDSYELKIRPVLQRILSLGDSLAIKTRLKQMKESLHQDTSNILHKFTQFEKNQKDFEGYQIQESHQVLKHSICHVSVEYYSTNEQNKYMIVKTIEEMEDKAQICYVLQTIRIFKEQVESEEYGEFSPKLDTNAQQLQSFPTVKPKTSTKKQKEIEDKTEAENKKKEELKRFKQVHQIIVSDTGPISKQNPYPQAKNQQPTSILYFGKYIYFFRKLYYDGRSKFVLYELDMDTQLLSQIDQFQFSNNFHDPNITIHFAIDGESKGPQLDFNMQELDEKEQLIDTFLRDQFVMLVDNFELDEIQIYSMKDLQRCLTKDIRISPSGNTKFNQIFVFRDCPNGKNSIEKLFDSKNSPLELCFSVMFDYHYAIIKIKLNEQNKFQCTLEMVLGYSNTDKKSIKQKKKEEEVQIDIRYSQNVFQKTMLQQMSGNQKHLFIGKQKVNKDNLKIQQIKGQIKIIQSICVLKYKYGTNEKVVKQYEPVDYFSHDKDAQHFDDQQPDHEEDQEEQKAFTRKKNTFYSAFRKSKPYVCIKYFIDENGHVQIMHTDESLAEGLKIPDMHEMNDYYVEHINHKIAHPCLTQKDNLKVKVTYVKNRLAYDDSRFVGFGLIEQVITPDQSFDSRMQQSKNFNYIVAQTNHDQFFYAFKKHNLVSHASKDEFPKYNSLFKVHVVKVKHLVGKNFSSDFQKQTIKFLSGNKIETPQIRMNAAQNGFFSSCYGIYDQKKGRKLEINERDERFENLKRKFADNEYLNQQNVMKNMVLERTDYQGHYKLAKIVHEKLYQLMEDKHKKQDQYFMPQFFFVPKSYFIRKDTHWIFIELKVFIEGTSTYHFVVENLIVKKSISATSKDQCILDPTTSVQLLVIPDEPKDILDDDVKTNKYRFKLSKPILMQEYNLFESRFFKIEKESSSGDLEINLLPHVKQNILRFQKIVEGDQDLIFFLVVRKQFLKMKYDNGKKYNSFDNFMIQAIHFHQSGKLSITPSKMINPGKSELQAIATESQLQLWRSSDFFKNSEGTVTVHFKLGLVLPQLIDRIQIQEFKIQVNIRTGKIKAKPISRIENLKSSIQKMNQKENVQIIQSICDSKGMDCSRGIMREMLDCVQFNNDQISARVIDFNKEGPIGINQEQTDLKPFVQEYQTPSLIFGYQKCEEDSRSFELNIFCKLSAQATVNKIFNCYEMYQLQKKYVKILLQLKPVMLQDFEFLLPTTYKTYEFNTQVQTSFFQPQELYHGQAMSDIHLNDTKKIHEEIKKFMEGGEDGAGSVNCEQLEGSLFDMVIQNNPHQKNIMTHSQFDIKEYLIISQDFNLKSLLLRSLDTKADNAYRILFECMNEINSERYVNIIEHDLYRLMMKEDIQELFVFFELDQEEEIAEQVLQRNTLCNFVTSIFDDRAPTIWNEKMSNFQMYSFRDTQNSLTEIVDRLINMSQTEGFKNECQYEVKHKCIDFQNVQLGEKLRKLQAFVDEDQDDLTEEHEIIGCRLDDFRYSLDDLQLAQMMIQNDNNIEFYALEAPQKIIDYQFQSAKKFFIRLFAFYVLGFILPQLVAFLVGHPTMTRFCACLGFACLLCFMSIELCQLNQLGAADYFFDFWNLVDFTQAFVFAWSTILLFIDRGKEGQMLELTLNLVSLIQAFSKALSFVRLSDDFGFLVRMIGMTIQELVPFLLFFFLYTSFFSIAFMILEIDTQNEYGDVHKNVGYFLYGMRNSIGDMKQPYYENWIKKVNEGKISQTDENLVATYIWLIWILQAMFMVIILLNYLIAVISQAYERSVNQKMVYSYIHKAQINQDYFMIQHYIKGSGGLDKLRYIVFVDSNQYLIEHGANWMGFMDKIKKEMSSVEESITSRFKSLQSEVKENKKNALQYHRDLKSQVDKIRTDQTQIRKSMYKIQDDFDTNFKNIEKLLTKAFESQVIPS